MKILLVGGGSGGHITPLLAVANQLKNSHPKCKVSIITERMGIFEHILKESDTSSIDSIHYINAGKYRRYYGETLLKKVIDVKTILFNFRDAFKLLVGVVESFWLLIRIRPNVVFIKGGYVGVPVGLACRLLRIPYVTHDSDALPGLTNRLISKKAKANAVGMPVEHYPYPPHKTVYVGIPITDDFLLTSEETRRKKRRELGLKSSDFLILITGGSNGALRLDKIVHDSLKTLLEKNKQLHIIHQVGKDNKDVYSDYPAHLHSRIRVSGFFKPLSEYIAASDAVIARAGATSITEVGMQKKPLIIVPNPYLSGGHQIKNSKIYEEKQAVLVINEHKALEDPKLLPAAVTNVINSPDLAAKLSKNLYALIRKDASKKIARLLIDIARKKGFAD
ncbi:MAG TPA: UDP-N-acetylglucosamine--N-acetylmuramyl-(pentapeptide) pyrophosphoryl-undecaprenol N-acetylglucosamine transferase [Candidatus Saccharimonadales bacterium]|nr:UDP-N-acetylglucosamine--N-acetylmuramyl-(pentapeptide) pyrophosphoryl-undecaprenol N-acetylglucosamine transferase [Candidatus Saccharimonadales bacterium]